MKKACISQLKKLQIALVRTPQKITDENEKIRLMTEYHTHKNFGGHCGQKKLYANLRYEFF